MADVPRWEPRRARRRWQGRDGDRVPTWEEIARDEGDFIYTVAYRLTGNREDAQDLVQEVLVRVQRGLRTYRPGSLRAWLGRITTNAFLDDARRRTRRPVSALPEDPDAVLPAAPDAAEASEADGLPDHVQAALGEVPTEFRVPVVLADVVGLSYTEIADQLGIPVGTVRSRIHRGRLALREALA
ncbi:MAG TPA: sigma-70 family RNA polymerase sigma factor [Acidimicrobiales bacterium]|nr:sigma-70 family RNA polymerase sigma factor [Acidimicrobiales bacterium]